MLSMAFDSDKKKDERTRQLGEVIDPDAHYLLYGDSALTGFDARSSEKLYLKIERDKFYALFGDYVTGLNVTELTRYNRSLTGLKTEFKNDRMQINAFASQNAQNAKRDEIRGDGTSGLYRLSANNAIINSEKITIEVRDRFHSETIIKQESLARFVDYSIDYEDGTLFFKRPIQSRDENLNPIFIVIEYETYASGKRLMVGGARGALKFLDDKLEVGVTAIAEETLNGADNMQGLDATVSLSHRLQVKAEIAHSDKAGINKQAYRLEVLHQSEKLNARAYLSAQEDGFGLGQQRGSENASRKKGGQGSYRISDEISATGNIYRQDNTASSARRDVVEGSIGYSPKHYQVTIGATHAKDTISDGTNKRENQISVGASRQLLGGKLNLRVRRDQSLGKNENTAYPTRTLIGTDYRLNEKATVFAESEWTQGDERGTRITRAGISGSPWRGAKFTTSLGDTRTERDERLHANVGLNQSWKINKQWLVDASIDQSRTIRHKQSAPLNINAPTISGDENDFSAISLGASYRQEKWSWAARAEKRSTETQDKINFLTGIEGEIKRGIALAVRTKTFTTNNSDGSAKHSSDLSLGLAYRPLGSRWMLLERLDLIINEEHSPESRYSSARIINNSNLNYKITNKTQASLKYGVKYVKETIDEKNYDGVVDLMGVEVRHDITQDIDISVFANRLHSYSISQTDYSAGASVGMSPVKNMWLSLGYNIKGFSDEDFDRSHYTQKGAFVRFRMKFDQNSLRDLLK